METQLYTIHRHGRSGEIEVVGEPGWLAVVPPLWALYEGLWLILAVQIGLIGLAAAFVPVAAGTVYLALVLLTVFDGNSFQRVELRLRGWRVVAAVEAGTPEGAEERFLTGEAVETGRGR